MTAGRGWWPRWADRAGRWQQLALDLGVVVLAGLDVALWSPPPDVDVQTYSNVLSWVAVVALLFRRRFPLATAVLTFPGYLVGWSQLAAIFAMYSVARHYNRSWQTVVGAVLVFVPRTVLWPPEKFFEQDIGDHLHNVMYGFIVTGLPLAVGLLVHTRGELSQRLTELAESREREKRLHAHSVLAEERARLAREMHDVVSHQVTLIAMQAGALQVSTNDADARETAQTIRTLSTRTLEELRQMVSVLRVAALDAAAASQRSLADLPELIAGCGVDVQLSVGQLPESLSPELSTTAFRTVQEALTNVRKHAPGVAAEVRLQVNGRDLLVEVRNEAPAAQSSRSSFPSGGHGLVGLRERAELLAGTFEAGPTADGGYVVRARLPLRCPPRARR
ncbi:sensor histidine kinase [Longimycelium tulufanense]|uniref:sensor histidine kinase n=1 Tax=Longimycelium tulufanense TaxID=907463 RepID=UPI001E4646D2|nr:histidine kinase [Longimycelium tulufanense]